MKKLAIVGSGSETRENAPYNDPSFDIWVFNEAAQSSWCKRYDAVFQMHKPEIYTGHNTKNANHWAWLQEAHGKPVYMQAFDERVPDCVVFPLGDALKLGGEKYLSASICDAIALAVLQGYEHVEIFGVEMSFTEYQYQAECFRFWIGFLKGRIGSDSVVLHSGKKMFDAPLYGYEGDFALGKEFFDERAKALDGSWISASKNFERLKKAFGEVVRNGNMTRAAELGKDIQVAATLCGEYAGALAEAERYAAFGDRYADRGGFEYAGALSQSKGEEHKVMMLMSAGAAEYIWNAWKQTKNPQAANQLLEMTKRMADQAYEMGAHLGMYKENVSYIVKYDGMVLANGGAIAPVPTREMVSA